MKKILLAILLIATTTVNAQTIQEYKQALDNISIQTRVNCMNNGDTLTILKDEYLSSILTIKNKKNIVIRNPYNFKIESVSSKAIKLVNCYGIELDNLIFITSDLKGSYLKRTINKLKQRAWVYH